jgi:hypothetical protein
VSEPPALVVTHVQVSVRPGAPTHRIIGEAVRLAASLRCPVDLTHHGVKLRAQPGDRPADVLRRFSKQLEARRQRRGKNDTLRPDATFRDDPDPGPKEG